MKKSFKVLWPDQTGDDWEDAYEVEAYDAEDAARLAVEELDDEYYLVDQDSVEVQVKQGEYPIETYIVYASTSIDYYSRKKL